MNTWIMRAAVSIGFAVVVFGMFGIRAGAEQARPEDGWRPYSQRPEIMPKAWIDRKTHFGGEKSLAMGGGGNAAACGSWQKTVAVEGGRSYRFAATCLPKNVDLERRSVLARIVWNKFGSRDEKYEYPGTLPPPAGSPHKAQWRRIESWVTAPKEATEATLELIFRWDADGEVYWDNIVFEPADRPERKVRIATLYCRPRGTKTPRESVERFAELVLKAAEHKPDFICLPEGITVIGTGKKYLDVAETVPGPTTKRLGDLAQQTGAHLVAGIYERVDATVYNTAVLVGPDGRLIGRYRKAALPDEEIDGGITPGDLFPVFDTPHGRVGMMICWDVTFPEPARALAARGAEIIFLPIWGGNETLMKARAIENQVHLVSSSYDAPTAVFDRRGEAIATANENNPIAVVEVDLAETVRWPWLGDYRGRIPREAPPVTGEK